MGWLRVVRRAVLAAATTLSMAPAARAQAAAPLSSQAEEALARGRAGAPSAIVLWGQEAAARARAGDAAGEAAAWKGVARGYALLEQPDSVLVYVGKALARDGPSDSASGRVARLLDSSPALHPSRSLTDEARFVRSVRALLAGLPGGELLARRVTSVREADASLEQISGEHKARVEIVGDRRGVEVAVVRYALRDSPAILPMVLATDTVVYLPAVAYQFRYRLASGRDTTVSRPCARDCRLRVVRGEPARE